MVEATRELGIRVLSDGQGGDAAGGFFCPHTQKPVDNTRSSARAAQYDRAVIRNNMNLIQGAHATKVVFEGNKAVGVEVSYTPMKRELLVIHRHA